MIIFSFCPILAGWEPSRRSELNTARFCLGWTSVTGVCGRVLRPGLLGGVVLRW